MGKAVDMRFDEKALTYSSYLDLLNNLLDMGKTTGRHQSPELTEYARHNMKRMQALTPTIRLLPQLQQKMAAITEYQDWYVLTEGWCGDAAQSIPVLHAISQLNNHIRFKLLLRDDNLDIMDLYLQYGKSRSIPKLVVRRSADQQDLFNWGPRPLALQEIYDGLKQQKASFSVMKEVLHDWYVQDQTLSVQKELLALLG